MYENAHIQTIAVNFSRRREQEASISRTLKDKIKRSVSQL